MNAIEILQNAAADAAQSIESHQMQLRDNAKRSVQITNAIDMQERKLKSIHEALSTLRSVNQYNAKPLGPDAAPQRAQDQCEGQAAFDATPRRSFERPLGF